MMSFGQFFTWYCYSAGIWFFAIIGLRILWAILKVVCTHPK